MFARTARLMLRPGFAEDAPALAAAIGDPAILRNLARAPCPYTPADAEAFLARAPDPQLPNMLVFARRPGGPQLVGGIGLHRAECGGVELGYWFARAHWGRGYATEAGRAVVAMAHGGLRIDRLVAGHFLDNPASGAVLRKLGFRATGAVALRHSLGRGCEAPCAIFARGAEDMIAEDAPAQLAA